MSYLNWKKLKKKLKNIGAAVGLSAVAYTTMGCSLTNSDENAFEIVSITDDKLPDNFDEIVESSQVALNVSPTGNRYADIYKTIDMVKEVLSEYDINAPIFYNIDALGFSARNSRANALLAEEFCNKLTANGCYVGLYGRDDSMENLEVAFKQNGIGSIDLYDKLIVYDSDDISYDGVYHMGMNSDGKLKTTFDVVKVIEDNHFNEKENFVDDATYVVESGDYLSGIAKYYGIKTVDLALYNGLCREEVGDTENENDIQSIYPGEIIVIPNTYSNTSRKYSNKSEEDSNKDEEKQVDFQGEYVVKSGDSIEGIAKAYGISEELFCEKNDLYKLDGTKKIIYPGDVLKVPSSNDEKTIADNTQETKKEDYNSLDEQELPSQTTTRVVKGVDLSFWNGVVDWEKVKNAGGVDFAILQICDFYNVKGDKSVPKVLTTDLELKDVVTQAEQSRYEADIQFLENVKGCIDNSIPFGIYYYTRAKSVEDAVYEAETVIATLENTFQIKNEFGKEESFVIDKVNLPIYMDVEAGFLDLAVAGKYNEITDAAMKTFADAGYVSGIYTSTMGALGMVDGEKFILGRDKEKILDPNEDNYISYLYNQGYDLWLVNNRTYTTPVQVNEYDTLRNIETSQLLQDGIDVVQYTMKGNCIGVPSTELDINFANKEFIDECVGKPLNDISKKKQRKLQ